MFGADRGPVQLDSNGASNLIDVSQSSGRVGGLRLILCSVTEAEEQREGRGRELGASE